jgi:polygalacturonase
MAVSALAAAPLEARDSTTVRPQDFGAVGDGMHNDTTAVREAFAKCAALGGCDLIIDDGVFLTGPVQVSSGNTRLIFGGNGTLLAAPRDQWIGAGWTAEAVLTASLVQNIAIQGPGKIDGNGAAWWAAVHDDLSYRPHMMALRNITDLTVDGVALLNSPNHNVFLHDCTAVRVTGLAVSAPHDSPNTDGINFCGGSDQSIVDSHISNGVRLYPGSFGQVVTSPRTVLLAWRCCPTLVRLLPLAIKPGHAAVHLIRFWEFDPPQDDCVSIVTSEDHKGEMGYGGGVIVSNVTCVYGHGISIGSIKHGTVTNVTVTNVTFISSENGARLKT